MMNNEGQYIIVITGRINLI